MKPTRLFLQGVSGGRAVARGRSTTMGAIKQVTGEELEKELSEWGTPIVLDVYAQVRQPTHPPVHMQLPCTFLLDSLVRKLCRSSGLENEDVHAA